jgi:hypothetical protein
MSSSARQIIEHNLVTRGIVTVPANSTYVLDARGCARFTPIFAAGAHTQRRCDAAGAGVGPAAVALVSGTPVTVDWPFYLIAADAAQPLTVAAGGPL